MAFAGTGFARAVRCICGCDCRRHQNTAHGHDHATAIVYVLLGVFCAEIAPAVNPQRKLAELADNTQRTVQGTIVRLGPARTLTTEFFSNEARRERSRQFDLRLSSAGDAARIGVYAPVDQPFPQLACGDVVRVTSLSA